MEQKNVGIIVLVILVIIVLLFFGSGMFGGEGEEGETPSGGGPGSPCASNEDCNEGLICVNGFCQDASCGPGGVCPPGFICIGDVCVDGSCSSEDPCPLGFVCVGGFCFPDDEVPCGPGGECPPGQECVEGFCEDLIPCSEEGECPPGQECVDGYCADLIPCTEDGDCPPGQECVDGFCGEEVCIPCTSTLDCASEGYGYICEAGCCEYSEKEYLACPITCGPSTPCEGVGQTCVKGCCIESSSLTIPSAPGPIWTVYSGSDDFCDGCPAEDSLPSMMFLGPNIEEGTTTVTIVVERADKTREVVEDATVFAEVLPNDGAPGYICRVLTDASGTALFNYSEYSECEDIGCKLKFTFCCADVSEGCLIPVCLNNPDIETYDMVTPCDSSVATWETEANVDGELIPIYPVIEMISIPPKPKFIGAAFTMELCLPILIIFGLLSAAMFASGRNPFQMFSIYRGRFKRAPQRAIRARGYTANFKSLINSVAGAVQSLKATEGRTLGEKAKSMHKGRLLKDKAKGLKKEFGKFKDMSAQGREIGAARKEKRAVRVIERDSKSKAGGKGGGAEAAGGQKGAGTQAAYRDVGDHQDMLEMTGGTVAGEVKAILAIIPTVLLGKLLAGSGLTSWLAYGAGEGEDRFKGLYTAVEDGLKASNAAHLAIMAPKLEDLMNFQVQAALDANGNQMVNAEGEALYITSYNDVGSMSPEESTLAGGDKDIPIVESGPMTAGEVQQQWAKTVAPAIVVGAIAGERIEEPMLEAGGDLHDAQVDVAEVGHEKYEVTVGEPISAEQASTIVNSPDQKISGSDAAAAIIKSDSLTTDSGAKLTDGTNFKDWANNMNAQATAQAKGEGPPIPDAELRMGGEIYHKAVDEFGAEAVAKDVNLAVLGDALVTATSVDSQGQINGKAPTQESADFGLYAQSMVAAANTEAAGAASGAEKQQARAAQANAMTALGNTYDAAEVLVKQGEGAKTHLTKMVTAFGADGRGDMGDPSRYNDNQKYTASMNDKLIEHQSFMLQNDIDDGKTAIGEYLSTTVFGPPQGTSYSTHEKRREAARVNMVEKLDPDRQGRLSLQALNPSPPSPPPYSPRKGEQGASQRTAQRNMVGTPAPSGEKAKPWKMNEKNYGYRVEKAQEYLEKTYFSEQLSSAKPGQEVDFAAARENASKRAADELAPLKAGYDKPRDDIALKSREAAYDTIKKTMDAQRPEPPAIKYDRSTAQHDLHLAFGASPDSKKMPKLLKKEFEEARKVEEANKERVKLEGLRDKRRRDQLDASLEASASRSPYKLDEPFSPPAKAPTDAERQKSEKKYQKAKENVDKQLEAMRKTEKEREAVLKKRQDEYNKRHYGATTPATRQSVRQREAEAKRIGEEAAKTAVANARKKEKQMLKQREERLKKAKEQTSEFAKRAKEARERSNKKKKK